MTEHLLPERQRAPGLPGAKAPHTTQGSRLPAWLWDLGAVCAVLLIGIVPGRPPGPFGFRSEFLIFTTLLVCAAAALLLVRRRWPIAALGGTLACFVVSLASPMPSLGVAAALAIAVYSFVERASRRAGFIVGGGIAAGIFLLSLWAAGWTAFDPRLLQIAAGVAIAAALGDSARSRRDYLQAMTERAERAEQSRDAEVKRHVSEERLHIARDLHDTVAHQLSVINLYAGVASGHLAADPERAEQALTTIRAAAGGAIGDIGELLRYLRASGEDGEAAAPQAGLEQLEDLLGRMREAGLRIDAQIEGELALVPGRASAEAYRLVQEGLTNALKHGSEARAQLMVSVSAGELVINIANPRRDPAAFGGVTTAVVSGVVAVGPGGGAGGLGLIGIRERVASLAGSARIEALPAEFVVECVLPIQEGSR